MCGGTKRGDERLAPLGGVYQAGTLSGNPLAMAAGLAALELIEKNPHFYQELEEKTQQLIGPIKEAVRDLPVAIPAIGSLFSIHFGKKEIGTFEDVLACSIEQFRGVFKNLFNKGIYPPPHFAESWFVSAAHTQEQLEYTKECILEEIAHLTPSIV